MDTVGIISLGCARNLVDSEVIMGLLKRRGYRIRDIEEGVDVAIVNTCGFVEDAKKESIGIILQSSRLKKEGKIRYLIVAGCLSQRYAKDLAEELPEVDSFVGTGDFVKIPEIIRRLKQGAHISEVSEVPQYLYQGDLPREVLTPRHYVYAKVSEGCSNRCSYCVIPQLRGVLRSRSIESLIHELTAMPNAPSVREINIIGQDTTSYGIDRYKKPAITDLLKKICALKNRVKWVRLLYTHPAHYTPALIDFINDEATMCKYLDLPVQHISDSILKRMQRGVTKEQTITLIRQIRKRIPDVALRTSIIIGFPGETEKDFCELIDFIKDARFERLGAFLYSREENTKAFDYRNQVPEVEQQRRFDELMSVQRELSAAFNKTLLGKECTVLVDEKNGDTIIGRTQWDAPEVDGTVYLKGNDIKQGEFYRAKIVDTLEYDLVGEAHTPLPV